MLRVLYTSESQLTFRERIGYSFSRPGPNWLRSDSHGGIYCGHNPWLYGRQVSGLYVQTYADSEFHETLHWTEAPRYDSELVVEVFPAQDKSEDVHFDVVWD